jgi:hypothetical protein
MLTLIQALRNREKAAGAGALDSRGNEELPSINGICGY